MKKCVIIGSGLGGLSCGIILAKNGYNVTVLEQGMQIGGCLQCFHRGSATFDTGMHYIGSADKGQTLHTILNYLGVASNIHLSKLDTTGYDVISFRGQRYKFANGRETFVNTLAEHFPNSREELYNYYSVIKRVAASSAMHSINRNIDININTEYKTKSVNEVIDNIISDKLLRQVLIGIQPLYAGVRDKTPFSSHALAHDCFEQSAYRIVGGSGSLAKSLANQITRQGGVVRTGQRATKIECNEYEAKNVLTEQGGRYPADLVICAIHPSNALKLVDSRLIKPNYRRRIEGYPNTPSVFSIYLKFKENRVKYMNHNLYYYPSNPTWWCKINDNTTWPKFLLYMHFCHKDNPTYAETGKVLTYMNFNEVLPWLNTQVGNRGESYEMFKKTKAELLLDLLEEEVPGIRNNIECYYTSTPLTYLNYTGTPDGSMYGIAKDINSIGLNSISCKTSVPNLLLAGQSITSHGMFGVLAGSLITCSEVLSSDVIFNQLKQNIYL